MFNKILVAFDSSTIGKYVFDEALSLAKASGASLMLLHVLSIEEKIVQVCLYSWTTTIQ